MKLLMLFLKKTELISELNDELKNAGITHGTIIDGKSMTSGLRPWSDDSIILGGMLRRANNVEYNEECKIFMFLLKNEELEKTKEVIENVIGNINEDGTGVLFTIPVDFVEGIGE